MTPTFDTHDSDKTLYLEVYHVQTTHWVREVKRNMTLALRVHLWLAALMCISQAATTRRVCDVASSTCEEVEVDPDEQTLGQKLLAKQTEVYHLDSLSYSEDNAAQSIKIYNPNDQIYDYYWYDEHRSKGTSSLSL